MKRFFCDKCGKCCEKLPALVIDPGLDDGTGKCKFYDSQTNLCTIYDQRPDICNVDMLFTPGTITYPFLECKISDDNGNEIAPTAVLPVGLHNFNYNSFYYRVREMTPPYMACFNKANYSLKVDPRHIDDDYVILHEMIHMHEFVLEIYPTYYHDAILYSLYHDLRSKIEDLDRRMERQGHIVMQEELAQFGGVHDLLFLLKSFDLDLRMNYPLGTVFGYGMAD